MPADFPTSNSRRARTQEKLNAANNKSDSLEGQEEALSEAEAAVSQDLVQNMASVQMLEQEIDKLNTQIDEKQKEYDAAKAKEDHQYELMKIRIKYMYEKGNTDYDFSHGYAEQERIYFEAL